MKVTDYNSDYFEVVPENATERYKLVAFPAFLRVKKKYLMRKSPRVVKNILPRLKVIHPGKIPIPKQCFEMYQSQETLLDIPSDFPWVNRPFPHQELALRFLYTNGGGGLLLEPGLGKTFVVLNYIKLMNFSKSLIICPKALLFVWEDEVAEHRPDLTVHVLKSTTWDKKIESAQKRFDKWSSEYEETGDKKAKSNMMSAKRALVKLPQERDADLAAAEAADIIVVNYDKVTTGVKQLMDYNFDFMAVDEGLIKDPSTFRTKAITKISTKVPFKTIMSGTLINNGPLDAYAPVRFLEPSLVGTAYSRFEEYYAHIVNNRGRRFAAGVPGKHIAEIRTILEASSIVMTKEWLDLPGKNFHVHKIKMSPQQEDCYFDLQSNYYTEIGGSPVEVENGLTLAGKLNQICNGFVYNREFESSLASLWGDTEEKGERKTLSIPNYKGDKFRELVRANSDRKVIVWYNYTAELDQIKAILDEEKTSYSVISGGCKNTGDVVRGFNNSGTKQVLVCQAQAVNYGITVLGKNPEDLDGNVEILPDFSTRCKTQIFWSLSYSLERFIQQQDRIHRIGQTEDCDYHILQTEDSIETYIWECLADKKSVNEQVLIDILRKLGR